jgi:ribosomal protein L31
VDATGRVEKFQKKFQRSTYGQKGKAAEAQGGEQKK